MSSVLIGIIGITLFVGLALAGALFLGPRFQDAQDNASASAFVAGVSDVASAANSFQIANSYTRGPAMSRPADLMAGGFLKSLPSDPLSRSGYQIEIVDAAGIDEASAADANAWTPRFVIWSLGSSKDICSLIERKLGNIQAQAEVSDVSKSISSFATKSAGCFRSTGDTATTNPDDYVVYSRI